MTIPALLLALRFGSAVLLLAFLGLLFWFLYADLKATRLVMSGRSLGLGRLRVIASINDNPPPDTAFDLSPITTLGRSARNTIVLDDHYVSGEHALLAWRDAQWWLEDLGSRNGVLLNDHPLTDPTVISPGDVVGIGHVQLKLELPGKREEEDWSGIRDSNP